MLLYYAPWACSFADHVALLEAGLPVDIERVDLKTKRTASGVDFYAVHPKGYVPVLVFEDGDVLTENIAILDWIASRFPALGVKGPLGRARLLEALGFISTELHVAFKPMWHGGDERERTAAQEKVEARLRYLAERMEGDFLFGDAPSVADFYLFVMLLWAARFGVGVPPELARMAALANARPSVRAALDREGWLATAA